MKRNKDRHQLAHSSSFRYRRPTSPYLVEDGECNSEFGSTMVPFAYPLEVDTSSPSPLPISPAFLKHPRDRSNSSCSLNYRGSPYDLSVISPDILNPLRRNSDPSSAPALTATAFTMAKNSALGVLSPPLPMEEECDQPLDMSKKSRTLSSESHHHHQLGSTSSSSSSTSSRSNTCSPESIYRGNHVNNNSYNGLRQQQMLNHSINSHHNHHLNQPHLYQSPSSNHLSSNNIINHHNLINSQDGNPHLQPRPSVITCASTLFGPRRSNSSSHHQQVCSNNRNIKDETPDHSPPSYHHHIQANSGLTSSDKILHTTSPRSSSLASSSSTSSSSSLSSSLSSTSSSSSSSSTSFRQSIKQSQMQRHEIANDLISKPGKKKIEGPNKLLILGEDSDSGIDEHFRRSLGEHYRSYTNVSMSVDDHFAKALGDTWLKLKRDSQNGSKGTSYNKNVPSVPS